MTRLTTRVVEELLFVIVLLTGGMMFQGVIQEARGENAGCANNTCKSASCIYWCTEGDSVVYEDTKDCLACISLGRCVSGQNVNCCNTDQELFFAVSTFMPYCDCAMAPADGVVEGEGDASGDWTDAERKQKACMPKNTGSGITPP